MSKNGSANKYDCVPYVPQYPYSSCASKTSKARPAYAGNNHKTSHLLSIQLRIFVVSLEYLNLLWFNHWVSGFSSVVSFTGANTLI